MVRVHCFYQDILKSSFRKGSVLEQRVTALLGHGLIAILLIPQAFDAILQHVPVPVLDGVFLYFAIASLLGNQVVTRWLLAFTESSAYGSFVGNDTNIIYLFFVFFYVFVCVFLGFDVFLGFLGFLGF